MSDTCCGKTLDVQAMEARQKRVLILVLAINATTPGGRWMAPLM